MTAPVLNGLIVCLICAGAIVFFVLLGLGLCRAAAMQSADVVEDTGEYE